MSTKHYVEHINHDDLCSMAQAALQSHNRPTMVPAEKIADYYAAIERAVIFAEATGNKEVKFDSRPSQVRERRVNALAQEYKRLGLTTQIDGQERIPCTSAECKEIAGHDVDVIDSLIKQIRSNHSTLTRKASLTER